MTSPHPEQKRLNRQDYPDHRLPDMIADAYEQIRHYGYVELDYFGCVATIDYRDEAA